MYRVAASAVQKNTKGRLFSLYMTCQERVLMAFSLFLPFSSFPVGLRDQLPTSANRLTADRLMGRTPQDEIEIEYSISSKSGYSTRNTGCPLLCTGQHT